MRQKGIVLIHCSHVSSGQALISVVTFAWDSAGPALDLGGLAGPGTAGLVAPVRGGPDTDAE